MCVLSQTISPENVNQMFSVSNANAATTYRSVSHHHREKITLYRPKRTEIHKYGSRPVSASKSSSTLLMTAKATVTDIADIKSKDVRILLDLASQRSFITQDVINSLEVSAIGNEKMIVNGFGQTEETLGKFDVVRVKLWNISKYDYRNVELHVVPFICNPLTNQKINLAKATYEHLINLPLADCDAGMNQLKIDVLIGADCYWKFVMKNIVKINEGPVAIETMFGWVLSGQMSNNQCNSVNIVMQHVLKTDVNLPAADEKLFDQLNKFWSLESIGIEDGEKEKCTDEKILSEFCSNIQFDGSNYHVQLPWKDGFCGLNDNYLLSRARLFSLLTRLRKKPEIFEEDEKVIRNQLKEGILEIGDDSTPVRVGQVYYLPHREVIWEKRETTKLHVVCDASLKTKGPSLNECMEMGPCLLPKVFDILVRFRSYKHGIISDIKSAFLNIRVLETFRDFLRFLWINDIKKENPNILLVRFTSVLY